MSVVKINQLYNLGFVGVNYNKILAYSRRGEHRSPVKKCDTYGIIALFANYKFIGQNANKKVNLLGPPMVDPTTVTQNFSIFYS